MTDGAVAQKKTPQNPEVYEHLTDTQIKFLEDLKDFVKTYPGFAGQTPFQESLGAKFQNPSNQFGETFLYKILS